VVASAASGGTGASAPDAVIASAVNARFASAVADRVASSLYEADDSPLNVVAGKVAASIKGGGEGKLPEEKESL
jgi:hypothetical protein